MTLVREIIMDDDKCLQVLINLRNLEIICDYVRKLELIEAMRQIQQDFPMDLIQAHYCMRAVKWYLHKTEGLEY